MDGDNVAKVGLEEKMVDVSFTEAELKNLAQLMDAGVKVMGLNFVIEAAMLKVKIENAIRSQTTG